MPRKSRGDRAGAWHHVMNRGIARRAVFEDTECVRYFLSRLAREVRAGKLEVHAFVVMTTHFHLLVRSPVGELSQSMRRVQNMYVRWFNRRTRRDGPLFRGRFLSRLVESIRYRRTLVRYIDKNPVSAGLVVQASQYKHGSARFYVRGTGPPWLSRHWVKRDALQRSGSTRFSAAAYRQSFGAPLRHDETELVELRIEHQAREADPLDDLVGSASTRVAEWMLWKANLADGTKPGLPCASGRTIKSEWGRARAERGEWRVRRASNRVDLWPAMLAGLLRDAGGLRWSEIGLRSQVTESTARHRYKLHRAQIAECREYREVASEIAAKSLV